MGRPPKPLDDERIADLHRSGVTITRLAKTHGVHNERIVEVLNRTGTPLRYGAWGSHHPRWRGGRSATGPYVRITLAQDDPWRGLADQNGAMFEHRYVMMKALGRPLLPTETVHHIDGDKHNNELANLQLRQGQHGEGVIRVCCECGSSNIKEVAL